MVALTAAAHAEPARTCLVVGIADGDTLTARCGEPGAFEQSRARVAAIDAPEKNQPFGQRSKQALSDLCFQQYAVLAPRDWDRYGRMVADIQCRGVDVGRHMVGGGWAWVFDRYAKPVDAPLFKLQDAARAQHAGLWQDSEPVPPWEWRRSRRDDR